MQAAFTKKTQEIAEARRQAEADRADAENFRKYQSHIQKIEEMQSRQTPSNPELTALEQKYREAGYSDEAIDMMKMGLEFTLNHFNQTQSQQQEAVRITNGIQEATKVDPRLTDVSLVYKTEDGETVTFGQMVEELVEADSNWKKDVPAATRRAIKKLDAMMGTAKTQGKEELSSAAKAKALKFPQTSSSPQSTSETETTGSIRDIGRQVMTELGMK